MSKKALEEPAELRASRAVGQALAEARLCATCIHLQREESTFPCSDCARLHPLRRGARVLHVARNATDAGGGR